MRRKCDSCSTRLDPQESCDCEKETAEPVGADCGGVINTCVQYTRERMCCQVGQCVEYITYRDEKLNPDNYESQRNLYRDYCILCGDLISEEDENEDSICAYCLEAL